MPLIDSVFAGNGKRASRRDGTKKRKRKGIDEEPIGLMSGLSSRRKGAAAAAGIHRTQYQYSGDDDQPACDHLAASDDFSVPVNSDEERRRKERLMRFSNTTSSDSHSTTVDAVLSALSAPREKRSKKSSSKKRRALKEEDGGNGFVGTCRSLEKPYFRLTTFPKADKVRNLAVLQQAFEHIKTKYRETEDFPWASEQLKSLRQDLTVQGLRNLFMLEVYEVHARLSLEEGDLNEFNQCQTMIKSLTMGMKKASSDMDGIELKPNKNGTNTLLKQSDDAADEFAAYRLLYAAVQNEWGEVKKELVFSTSVTMKDSVDKMSSKHAILVAKALVLNDYSSFFVLYDNAPNMSGYLMDFLVQRVRASAFERIISAYRPTVSVEFLRETLFFHDLEETRSFLKKTGNTTFVKEAGSCGPPFWVDCKASMT